MPTAFINSLSDRLSTRRAYTAPVCPADMNSDRTNKCGRARRRNACSRFKSSHLEQGLRLRSAVMLRYHDKRVKRFCVFRRLQSISWRPQKVPRHVDGNVARRCVSTTWNRRHPGRRPGRGCKPGPGHPDTGGVARPRPSRPPQPAFHTLHFSFLDASRPQFSPRGEFYQIVRYKCSP